MNNIRVRRLFPYYLCNDDKKNIEKILKNQDFLKEFEIEFNNNYLEYNWIDGVEGYYLRDHGINKLFSCIGEFHLELSKIENTYMPVQYYTHFPNLSEETIFLMQKVLKTVLQGKNDMCSCIFNTLERIERENLFYLLPKQIIHGDLHPGNIIVGNTKQISIIDFFDFHYSYRIIDVAWLIVYVFFWDEKHKKIYEIIDYNGIKNAICNYIKTNPFSNIEKLCLSDAIYVLLIFSVFSNFSLWRNQSISRELYKNLERINNIFEEGELEYGIFNSDD